MEILGLDVFRLGLFVRTLRYLNVSMTSFRAKPKIRLLLPMPNRQIYLLRTEVVNRINLKMPVFAVVRGDIFRQAAAKLPPHNVLTSRSSDADFMMLRSIVAVAVAEVQIGLEAKKVILVYMVRI